MTPRRRTPTTTTSDAGWRGLYLGDDQGWPSHAGPERTVLVLGPPRSGKTTSIVIPNVLAAPGPVVSTSTKPDVAHATGWARAHAGQVWLFDPSGRTTLPSGFRVLRWSPVQGCATWATAVARAHALAGAARPMRGVFDAHHWTERAQALLAPLLHAASRATLDISWVMRWVLRHDAHEPLDVLGHHHGHPFASEILNGIAHTDIRERSGIFSTAAGILAAYTDPAALATATNPNFDPDTFVHTADTVYVCAPGEAQDQLAPLVVAFLDQLRAATYRRQSGLPPVVWALDEAANIAPLPSLPSIVSDGGSQGLVTLACIQDLSQAHDRWGPAAEGFLSLFSTKVVLGGIADLRTLQLISALAGTYDHRIHSYTRPRRGLLDAALGGRSSSPTVTTSTQQRPRLPVDVIAGGAPGHALCIHGAHDPRWIRLTPWFEPPWNLLAQPPPQPEPAKGRGRRSTPGSAP